MGQLSFFSAEARRPCVADLAGLLCGPGRAVGFARGRAARISVHLDERWRGLALVAALAERGVQAKLSVVRRPAVLPEPDGGPAEPPREDRPHDTPDDRRLFSTDTGADAGPDEVVPDGIGPDEIVPDEAEPDGVVFGRGGATGHERPASERDGSAGQRADQAGPDHPEVEGDPSDQAGSRRPQTDPAVVGGELEVATAFRTDLTGLAGQWLAGEAKVVPADFTLHGGVLRLWALASGRWVESGYVLGLDPESPGTHEPLQKALAASGLPATLLKTGGPALRVVGRRRLERLAELVGRAPRGVVERTWPAA
ncbi:hypothetical protein FHS29_003297 [Saccharothrix tamanrassetensis]|uniref:Uncharacterized protein n=1 Tax=Saccharothrix tamanrassetensis TaxID=1051531 RepID=A0A841CH58_9PSEU|nr:hypothetical protein [Saccharothrix tamanrassetensis]MBB5956711.1 hypothetical protein [Saccharothrix tamanrassetensis]